MTPLFPALTLTHTQEGSGSQDDIQTLTYNDTVPDGNLNGGFKLIIKGLTVGNFGTNPSATFAATLLTQAGVTGVTVTGGPLKTSPLVFTTATATQATIQITSNTLTYSTTKWVPVINLIEYYEVVSNSIYAQTALWSTQAVYPTKTPTSGTVTLRLQTFVGQNQLTPVPYNCTAKQFKDAMAAISLNPLSYDVYGGPWPKPIVVEFKNSLRYQSQYRLTVVTNSLNNQAVPTIIPTGKQLLVTYHSQLKKHIVVRPGYV